MIGVTVACGGNGNIVLFLSPDMVSSRRVTRERRTEESRSDRDGKVRVCSRGKQKEKQLM